jgi:hypothetical protein
MGARTSEERPMTQTAAGGIETLRAAMTGLVLVPGDEGYHDARRVWNAGIETVIRR